MTPVFFLKVFTAEAKTHMSYRADFWIKTIVSFLGRLALAWFIWVAVFEYTGKSEIGGYTLQGMFLYYFIVGLVGRLVTGEELGGKTAIEIYEGAYTRYIIYPIRFMGFKYAQFLGAHFPMFIQGFLFILAFPILFKFIGGDFGNLNLSFSGILLGLLAVFLANLLQFMMLFCMEVIAFWADNVWSIIVMSRLIAGLLGGFMLPLELFPDQIRPILDFLPFKYLFYYPAGLLTGKFQAPSVLLSFPITLTWIFVFYCIAGMLLKKGDKVYTGVGI